MVEVEAKSIMIPLLTSCSGGAGLIGFLGTVISLSNSGGSALFWPIMGCGSDR